MVNSHTILGGKVRLTKRKGSPYWQCSTFLEGRNWRRSTEHESLELAKEFASDWYLTLIGKLRSESTFQGHSFNHATKTFLDQTKALLSRAKSQKPSTAVDQFTQVGDQFLQRVETLLTDSLDTKQPKSAKTFSEAADQFLIEAEALAATARGRYYVPYHRYRLQAHLLPFFGLMRLSEITDATIYDYRIHRRSSRKDHRTGEMRVPRPSTLHSEIVTLRQVLKTAKRRQWISHLPDFSDPFPVKKVNLPRPWFPPTHYRTLYRATRKRAANPLKERWRWVCEQMHDYVLFMMNSGLRPDEGKNATFQDMTIAYDKTSRDEVVFIRARGKTGTRLCVSMPGAVLPLRRLQNRLRAYDEFGFAEGRRSVRRGKIQLKKPGPADKLFPTDMTSLLNNILEEEGLKRDENGRARVAYSFRHSYICYALMEGNDREKIAQNCGTSVDVINNFYAVHIKELIDTTKINKRKHPGRLGPWGNPESKSDR